MSNRQNEPQRPQRADFQQALKSMDTYMDITVDDLMTLSQRAEQFANRRASEAIQVSHIMSQPVRSVRPQTPLSEAAHLMVTQRISGLPVVDEAGHLAGIITEADFLRALGVPAHQPHHNLWQTLESLFSHLAHHGEPETPDDPVTAHMVKNVVCVHPDQDLHAVIEVMKRNSVKRLVVCDHDRRVVGMVTRSDLVRLFFDRYTEARPG
ncbi:MAG: CBS domain-containing protein [Thiogranum sp.]|jgi:CBS-domain-containing membrane protein|nr:CBS domain-containing protein [Thiogranum sp.]